MQTETKMIKASEVFLAIFGMLEEGKIVRISVTGMSMAPFLHEKKDSVNLTKADYSKITRGSIVLVQRTDGVYVMHRVIKKNNEHFFMAGDAQQWIEGPLLPSQIKAVVESVYIGEYEVSCNNPVWRLSSSIWLMLLPARYRILGVGRRIKKVLRWLKKLLKTY